MKTYHGYRNLTRGIDGTPVSSHCNVTVEQDGHRWHLDPRLDIRNHSPSGFEWGYGGSGPAQLALALVADCCGRAFAVPHIYQRVKRLVAALPHDGWTLTEGQVAAAVVEAAKESNHESTTDESAKG